MGAHEAYRCWIEDDCMSDVGGLVPFADPL